MVMVIWDQEWAETEHLVLLCSRSTTVFCLKEEFLPTDTHVSSFPMGTQLGLPAAAHSNISSDKLGGFAFFPDRPLQK